jgi:hypothetical protein
MNKKTAQRKKITAAEFDEMFERGDDVSDYIDETSLTRRFHIEMPVWMLVRNFSVGIHPIS